MRLPGFVGGSYVDPSANVDCQRCINLYPEGVESGNGKAPAVLKGTPGLTVWATLTEGGGADPGPVRAILAAGSPTNNSPRCFAVAGSKLYELMSDATWTELGDVGSDTNHTPVDMLLNGTQLWVVSAGQSWLHDGVSLTSVGMPTARTGCFLDNYFIAAEPDSKNFFISALADGSSWDPIDYAVKEGYPDLIAAIRTLASDLWIFGEATIEVFRNTGNPDFPFERSPGAFIPIGTVSNFSPTRFAGGLAWLGVDEQGGPKAYAASGSQPSRISTLAIEAEWASYGVVNDQQSWTYTDGGHQFWVLDFPSEGKQWVFDMSTKLWHERAWWNGSALARPRPRCHAFVFGKHLVGDRSNGKVYEMSNDVYTDAGTQIVRQRTCPHMSDELKRTFYQRVQLDLQTGEINNPTITLDYSGDSGRTWSSAHNITAGASGDYTARAIWRRLGSGRDRAWRFTSTAAMRHVWIDAHIELTQGRY